jgi:hypothetical protein
MDFRCPTCKAPYREGTQCYRCQCDLGPLLTILRQAAELRNQSLCLLREGEIEQAKDAIQRSLFLSRDSKSEELYALICAFDGDFGKCLRFLKKRL